MPSVNVAVSLTVNLELSLEEAEWLRGVMQNPLWGAHPDQEDPKDQKFRHDLFTSLKQVDRLKVAATSAFGSMPTDPFSGIGGSVSRTY